MWSTGGAMGPPFQRLQLYNIFQREILSANVVLSYVSMNMYVFITSINGWKNTETLQGNYQFNHVFLFAVESLSDVLQARLGLNQTGWDLEIFMMCNLKCFNAADLHVKRGARDGKKGVDGQIPEWQRSWVCLCLAVAWQEPSPSPPLLPSFLPLPQNIKGLLILPPGFPPASSLFSLFCLYSFNLLQRITVKH